MGSHADFPPLVIRAHYSPRLALFAGVNHALASALVWALPLGIHGVALMLLVAASAGYVGYVHVLARAPWSIRSATWLVDGTWLLILASGRQLPAHLSASTFVSLPLVVLNFRCGWWYRRALPLFSDALDAGELRRLRQQLRIRTMDAISDRQPMR